MTETGIYGGSFNPIHRGHVELAERLCRDEGLDELWFMVSPQNPFKKSSPDLLNENIRLELARMAVEETGRGVYEDKVIKNMFATEYIWHDIKKEKTVGVLDENEMEGYVEVAEPVGVIAGVTPTTNPTSTTLFKSLIAVKTRNPIIFGFHPSAQK